MGSSLNLPGIGEDRLAALEAEASAQGVSVEALVLTWIDQGLSRSRAERDRADRAQTSPDAKDGLYSHGTSLGRFVKD
ncbi:hypothetical protein [Maritimibacter sp. DP1N21-5]|uniref:hypothetical protein n=1 Tax=Maritimibacter sp. DP1N21-5 TaxID=2836867 RepID=UPI001C4615BF|nr:hypothetical protein [Maritimibacter sp. DP1N21-5]MBV7409767.1 hypothetical protein [Maritimibacter sp. DP1N21-5]